MSITQLWAAFAVMFPRDMKSYGPASGALAQAWEKALEGHDLEKGMLTLKDSGATFLPSLPEFIALCKGPKLHPDQVRYERERAEDEALADLEKTGRKLLAGNLKGSRNRIVKKADVYRHERLIDGEWVDNADLNAQGLLPKDRARLRR